MSTRRELELLSDHYSMKELISMVAYKCTYPRCQNCLMCDEPSDSCTIENAIEEGLPIHEWFKIMAGRYKEEAL